jgi:hypothetical protein
MYEEKEKEKEKEKSERSRGAAAIVFFQIATRWDRNF